MERLTIKGNAQALSYKPHDKLSSDQSMQRIDLHRVLIGECALRNKLCLLYFTIQIAHHSQQTIVSTIMISFVAEEKNVLSGREARWSGLSLDLFAGLGCDDVCIEDVSESFLFPFSDIARVWLRGKVR